MSAHLEYELYRRVFETKGSHAREVIAIAREHGIPRRHVEAMVNRAAIRDSYRIAGMTPPTPGAVTWTYTGKSTDHLGWTATVYDADYQARDLAPEEVRTYVHAAIDERRGLDIPAVVRDLLRRPSDRRPTDATPGKGSEDSPREWTPSDPLIEAQASGSEIRRCALCKKPMPATMRSDAEVCSPKHRRLLHRLRKGDPTVHEAIRMETNPPPCLGCGKPLAGRRAGTKFHNDYCRRLAGESRQDIAATTDQGGEVSPAEWTRSEGVSAR